MEKFIPLLIGLAIFGFKSYQNYVKEQEAALKRKKSMAPVPTKAEKPVHKTYVKETRSDAPKPSYIEEIKEMNEIQRFKKDREEHRLAMSRKTNLNGENQKKDIPTEDFDLRKAVVMSIILDRPYK
ncbi:hypothetical protein [Sphingobacterium faecium]|uniref:hypothetical protein n=1 Tax=Sphingobacterium faecium TaxID=34087 RepID=UPI00246837E1|nr:hypothetical protein [Sphingobacterium faecium]MDH5825328.1 hypothetical protein [Sphingobacterium faecium]